MVGGRLPSLVVLIETDRPREETVSERQSVSETDRRFKEGSEPIREMLFWCSNKVAPKSRVSQITTVMTSFLLVNSHCYYRVQKKIVN